MDSGSSDVAFFEVVFTALGDDDRIHQLNKHTNRRLNAAKRIVNNCFYIELKLGQAKQERNALRIASTWLERHQILLKSLHGRKRIEVCTCLGENDGSRFLSLEPSFCGLLHSLDCVFSHQACAWRGPRAATR